MNGRAPSSLQQTLHRPRHRPLQHSFHVLTDGSEHTGHGCLFLSIQPTPNSTIKYALTGLCEQVSRLAADQKYPLHYTRAVFCPSTSCLDGLASLLLTLQQAGAPQLVVCGGDKTSEMVEGIVEIALNSRTTHPQILTCEIESKSKEWCRIYYDEYLAVHGKSVDEGVVLVYTMIEEEKKTSFATMPPECGDNVSIFSPLPEYCGGDPLDFCLCLNDSQPVQMSEAIARRVLRTAPSNNTIDNGLLIRAQYHARQRRDQCPFLYPFNTDDTTKDDSDTDEKVATTCARWKLGDNIIDRESYKQEIWERCQLGDDVDVDTDVMATLPLSCQDFYGSALVTNEDENEIDLDDDVGEDENDKEADYSPPAVPHLLVLGTGCATPSPLRGSSGYALFVAEPSSQSQLLELKIVIECGEGYVTSLHRHLPPGMTMEQQLSSISIIWISHAHLDHYGGLPCLLREIQRARNKTQGSKEKKRRFSPPLVVAPAKVLRYLKILLSYNSDKILFEGLTHSEWSRQPLQQCHLPFRTMQSIQVDHCPGAHGLVLEWNDGNGENVMLVYSGDCRPSLSLIRHVTAHQQRSCRQQEHLPKLTVLLHEATFVDDDAHLACSKRHSTVSEALQVAKDMNADATLLTHFSSRNVKPLALPTGVAKNDERMKMNYGYCDDGLWLPMTRMAMSNVYRLKS